MLHDPAVSSGFQILPEGEKNPSVEARFIAPLWGDDKKALAHLLKLVAAEALASRQPIDLDANEALLRLVPILCAYFSREELVDLLGEKVTARMLELHRLEVVQNLFLEEQLRHLLHVFNEAHISLMLFKGPALAHTVYPDAHLRTYHDFDAFIHPDDLARADGLLTQMGYEFYEEYRSNVIDQNRTGYNYTQEHQDSWLKVVLELHTAPHPSEIGTLFDIESMWAKAQPLMMLGEPTLTMYPIDHLLYLCWHYRFHSFSRLLWLYDIGVMLRAEGPELEWTALIQAAQRQQLASTLYYCLSWCRDLFGVDIPAEVFVSLRPPFICRHIVERIAMPDMAEALVLPHREACRVIAHRAMVDRTTGIFKVGFQTLFPAPAALARRYMDHSHLPLRLSFLYYPIHPWITIAKGYRYFLGDRNKRK